MATKYDADTIIRLIQSYAKWHLHSEGVPQPIGAVGDCPLCRRFFKSNCLWCPISDETGENWCKNTPYPRWVDSVDREETEEVILSHAKDEADFLRDLLYKIIRQQIPKGSRLF